MRLRNVKLIGFKTFADRVDFEITSNLTAIVGPNGCGKSNIVDAVLWALGEHNPRALRAVGAGDIIFSGSKNRKPLGMAEVALTFDNSDHALPIDAAEVCVSRRIYRNGETEYAINRKTCRLKDVVGLFADTGLGRGGYSIISQREVDGLLNAGPDELRLIIDEVAGAQKYRLRKQETIKRLNSAENHLQRVDDILTEIERELGPLRQDAETAKLYQQIFTELQSIECGVLITEFSNVVHEIERIQRQLSEGREALRLMDDAIAECENNIAGFGKDIAKVESGMDALRMQLYGAISSLERAESASALLMQKEQSLTEQEQSLKEEISQLSNQVSERKTLVESLQATLDKVDLEADNQAEREALERRISDMQSELAELEAKTAEQVEQRLRRENYEAEQKNRSTRAETLNESIIQLQAEAKSIDGELSEIKEKLELRVKEQGKCQTASAELQSEADILQRGLLELNSAIVQTSRTAAELEGKLDALQRIEDSYEGYQTGAAFVLKACKLGQLEGRFISVADAIEVPQNVVTSIETALGGAMNDIIASSSDKVEKAIRLLNSAGAGRAVFWPLDLLEPLRVDPRFETLKSMPGVLGSGSDIVECSIDSRGVIETLLGRILIVETLDIALKIARDYRQYGWTRIATLDGELITNRGSVTGGKHAKPRDSILQRKVMKQQFESELSQVCKERDKLIKQRDGKENRIKDITVQSNKMRQTLEALNDEARQLEKRCAQAEQKLAGIEQMLKQRKTDLEQLSAETIEPPMSANEAEIAELAKRRQTVRESLDSAKSELMRIEATSAERQRRASELKGQIDREQGFIAKLVDEQSVKLKKLNDTKINLNLIAEDIAKATKQKDEEKEKRFLADVKLEAMTDEKQRLLEQNIQAQNQVKEMKGKRGGIVQSLHESELAGARLEVKSGQLAQKLLEEFQINRAEALDKAETIELPPNALKQAGQLRRDLKALGNVNLGAIDACERLNARQLDLTEQKTDILESKRELENAVREIDRHTRKRFAETFAEVNKAFSTVFMRLFEGGTAELTLDKPDNLLESGVRIDIQLPGKRKQSLELLSGGERSLTAVAFLFALMMVKPSPVCVLDEADAALDGRNVERFVDLLTDFARNSQFIIVTHNPTTIAAANSWYGVTMSEPGVSRIIPYKMSDAEALVEGGAKHLNQPVPKTQAVARLPLE